MSKKKMNSRSLESVAQELVSAMMTSAYLLEKAVSINDDVSISTEKTASSNYELRAATRTSALLIEINRETATMTSAYLLEEAGFSKAYVSISVGGSWIQQSLRQHIESANVSISVEKGRGIRSLLKLLSTDTVPCVTVDKAVGRYYYRSCWQTSP
ncbi:hypothetical protein F511_42920 [Dorcoceras hygrometricum]|uniref:Uncharacterized protein n=1 Tax=Dorcoceras hygrometricum TaxID=472368 RepID=A0A2Z7BE20_9LAMI|nr:hypothetical protein F511_42920 [Dorcoceras hygrometricum]